MKRFSADVYQNRREALAKQFENQDVLIFPGNTFSPKNYQDNYYHFRQDSSFLYYAGLDLPDMALILDISTGKSMLYGHEVTIQDVVWTGWQPSLAELSESVGIDAYQEIENLEAGIRSYLEQGRTLHYLPPYRGETTLLLANCLDQSPSQVLSGHSALLTRAVIKQREIKEDREVTEIEKALSISKEAHLEIIYTCQPGLKEADVVAAVKQVCARHQVTLAYNPIVTVNGEILHNHYHGNVLKEGDLLLCDVGAESQSYYASDITRTFPVSLQFTDQQKNIYALVRAMLQHSTDALMPDTSYQSVHLGAARVMIEGLQALGLMHGDAEEALYSGAGALFFPHGLGHMMGFDVHDMEGLGEDLVGYDASFSRSDQFGLRSLRLGKPLEVGHVLTVEPGIYFIEKLIDQWEADKKFNAFINYDEVRKYVGLGGVRLEDDYLITANGGQLLGPSIPIEMDEIEFLRGSTRTR
ncbi:MAG: aminopeptidase P N-terminal domain-containing protein [Saprospiraceae bacterium]|nr:aminopeptidase P N-terminal domain-containing protein [Saprospiraceae bacterium]